MHALDAVLGAPRQASASGAEFRALAETLRMSIGGGRGIRPRLVRASYAAFGGTDARLVTELADAVELLHTAFLVHDDVLDGDDVRRGRLNTIGAFRRRADHQGAGPSAAAAYGDAAGILAGDLALAGAVAAVGALDVDAVARAELLQLVLTSIRTTADGELADVHHGLGLRVPSLDESLATAEKKTAAYTFRLPLVGGARLAGPLGETTLARLDLLARHLGLAFQLADDLEGVFGDPAVTGKSRLSDLREGKRTPLLCHASTTSAWARIAPLVGDPNLDEERAAIVRAELEAAGSRRFVEDLAHRHLDDALRLAGGLGLADAVRDVLDLPSPAVVAAAS